MQQGNGNVISFCASGRNSWQTGDKQAQQAKENVNSLTHSLVRSLIRVLPHESALIQMAMRELSRLAR